MSVFHNLLSYLSNVIQFKDINIKNCLLSNSTINPDGTRDITYNEAKNPLILSTTIKEAINPNHTISPNTDIESFDEFEFFENVDKIEPETFSGCTNLKSIKFPKNALNYGDDQNSTYQILKNTAVSVLHLENQNGLTSYASFIQKGTMFGSISSLTEIWIPNVTTINGNVFTKTDNPNIEKIVVGSVVQWLLINTVNNVNRPNVSEKAYLYLESDTEHPITDITTLSEAIPNRTLVPTVFAYSFYYLKGLRTITISAPHTKAEKGSFAGLSSDVTIINYGYIETVDKDAFYNCKAQGMDNIPSSLTSVEENSFRNSALKRVSSETLTSISSMNSFANNTELELVNIPNCNITGQSSFSGCTKLEFFYADSTNTVSYMCSNCTKLKIVELASATTIKLSAFFNCSNLTTVDAPLITVVESDGFRNCTRLTNLTIGLSHLTKIGETAFLNVPITCPTEFFSLTEISTNAFSGCYSPSTGYVIFRCTGFVTFKPGNGPNAESNYSKATFGSKNNTYITKIYVLDDDLTIDGVTKSYLQWYLDDTKWARFLELNPTVSFDIVTNIPT